MSKAIHNSSSSSARDTYVHAHSPSLMTLLEQTLRRHQKVQEGEGHWAHGKSGDHKFTGIGHHVAHRRTAEKNEDCSQWGFSWVPPLPMFGGESGLESDQCNNIIVGAGVSDNSAALDVRVRQDPSWDNAAANALMGAAYGLCTKGTTGSGVGSGEGGGAGADCWWYRTSYPLSTSHDAWDMHSLRTHQHRTWAEQCLQVSIYRRVACAFYECHEYRACVGTCENVRICTS